MAVWAVCLRHTGDHFVHSAYASFYFCAVHAEQLSRQSVERDGSHAWLFQPWQKSAGAIHRKSYGKHFPLWMHAAGFPFAFLLFFDLKLCNPCGKSL